MLGLDEGVITTCVEPPLGSLAFLYAHSEGATPLLIVELEKMRRGLLLNALHESRLIQFDHQATVLSLGIPVVRYSPNSRRQQGHEAQAGDLVFAKGRYGIRASAGYANGFSRWQTPVAWLDGSGTMHNHDWQDHVFQTWELGFNRGDEFIKVAASVDES